jgi:hypothetical protein
VRPYRARAEMNGGWAFPHMFPKIARIKGDSTYLTFRPEHTVDLDSISAQRRLRSSAGMRTSRSFAGSPVRVKSTHCGPPRSVRNARKPSESAVGGMRRTRQERTMACGDILKKLGMALFVAK